MIPPFATLPALLLVVGFAVFGAPEWVSVLIVILIVLAIVYIVRRL